MSGICGIVDLSGRPVDAGVLHRLVAAADHRGPDGARTWVEGGVGLVHLALTVTPESVSETQPLAAEPGLVLVSDARLDNRAELISALSTRELTAACPSDTQILLAAYRRWGTDCPARLLGDFAFAVWDGPSRRLFAARDAIGMRSLSYRAERQRIVFGTEVKQVLAAPDVPVRPFDPMVAAFLAGASAPPAWTYYEGIASLPPAHALVFDSAGLRTWRFWDVDPEHQILRARPEEYAEEFRHLFVEAVRCRLRSVKPVAITLSGGMDSGSVAATAGWLLHRSGNGLPSGVHTYSWAFSELPECDERHISSGIVEHYDLPHSDVPAEEAWPLHDYPAAGPDRDEPLMGPYEALWKRTMTQERDEGMGLVLTGICGDLVVGESVFDDLGLLMDRRFGDLGRELQRHRQQAGLSWPHAIVGRLLRPALASLWPPDRAAELRRRLTGGPRLPVWMTSGFARRTGVDDLLHGGRPAPPVHGHARRQRYDLLYAPNHLQTVTHWERAHARFGLAYADPWSDRRLAEFVLAVPQWTVQSHRQPKSIAHRAMRGILPDNVRRCVRKITPESLFYLAMKERARHTVLDLVTGTQAGARGYLEECSLRGHFENYLAGQPLDGGLFWSALSLEMWLRRHWSVSKS